MEKQEININAPVKSRTKKETELHRICDNLPIIDCFVSLQGEGKYAGYPSLFIRVSGCNLRCCFQGSICDTAYSSFRPEKGHYTKDDVVELLAKYPLLEDIVITGGEPMMYQEGLGDLMEYIELITDRHFQVTVETNGTIAPDPSYTFEQYVCLYSISPKLKTSVPVPHKEYMVPRPDGTHDTISFDEESVEKYNKIRRNIPALVAMMDSTDYQLKFVYSNLESLKDIDDLLQAIKDAYGSAPFPECIMLMPEGTTTEQLDRVSKEAAAVCIERGYHFSDRLHIRIWGDKRGF